MAMSRSRGVRRGHLAAIDRDTRRRWRSSSPAIMRISVDLPQPEAPTMTSDLPV